MPDTLTRWCRRAVAAGAPLVPAVLLAGLAAVLLGGCDFLAVTDEQLVKNRIREHAEAVTAAMSSRDWGTAAAFYDSTGVVKWQRDVTVASVPEQQQLQQLQKAQPGAVTWQGTQRATVVLQGREAAKGFLKTLSDIYNMDEFFTVVHSITKIRPDLIEAKVTMQAHIVLSSTELNFSNRFWEARMGWVKRGPGKWQICYIIEDTAREDGKFSRL